MEELMRKRLLVSLQNFYYSTALSCIYELIEFMGGINELFIQAIDTLLVSYIADINDIWKTEYVLRHNVLVTLDSMLYDSDETDGDVDLDNLYYAFLNLCLDLHDVVWAYILPCKPGLDVCIEDIEVEIPSDASGMTVIADEVLLDIAYIITDA